MRILYEGYTDYAREFAARYLTGEDFTFLYRKGWIWLDNKLTLKFALTFVGQVKFFDEFKKLFPIETPDRSRKLHAGKDLWCRNKYNSIIKNNVATHDWIMKCLAVELNDRRIRGQMNWMPKMERWLKEEQWKLWEEDTRRIEGLVPDSDKGPSANPSKFL